MVTNLAPIRFYINLCLRSQITQIKSLQLRQRIKKVEFLEWLEVVKTQGERERDNVETANGQR